MKFRELETVVLERDIPERGLLKRDLGGRGSRVARRLRSIDGKTLPRTG
jgi:hypothetical protein